MLVMVIVIAAITLQESISFKVANNVRIPTIGLRVVHTDDACNTERDSSESTVTDEELADGYISPLHLFFNINFI